MGIVEHIESTIRHLKEELAVKDAEIARLREAAFAVLKSEGGADFPGSLTKLAEALKETPAEGEK